MMTSLMFENDKLLKRISELEAQLKERELAESINIETILALKKQIRDLEYSNQGLIEACRILREEHRTKDLVGA